MDFPTCKWNVVRCGNVQLWVQVSKEFLAQVHTITNSDRVLIANVRPQKDEKMCG